MDFTISINKLKIHAPIGVFPDEKKNGNDFEVTVSINLDIADSDVLADNLDMTLNYAEIVDLINNTMNKTCNLIETVAAKIALAIEKKLKDKGIILYTINVRIAKLNPPIPGALMESASVETTIHS